MFLYRAAWGWLWQGIGIIAHFVPLSSLPEGRLMGLSGNNLYPYLRSSLQQDLASIKELHYRNNILFPSLSQTVRDPSDLLLSALADTCREFLSYFLAFVFTLLLSDFNVWCTVWHVSGASRPLSFVNKQINMQTLRNISLALSWQFRL